MGGDDSPELGLCAGGDVVVMRVEDDDGGVLGRDPELERFLSGMSATAWYPEYPDTQRVEFEHVCMRVCGADDQARVARLLCWRGFSLRGPPEGRGRAADSTLDS